MIRSFKYRLRPNEHQQRVFDTWLEQCRQLYNAALEQRVTAYREHGRSLSLYEQQKQLTELRDADPSWAQTSVLAQRSALFRLDRAFKHFFSCCRAGVRCGLPRFRGRGRYDAFAIHGDAWTKIPPVTKDRLYVPKLGHVKMNLYRPIGGEIRDVTVFRDGARRWWVSFACYVGEAPAKVAVSSAVGIDLGLASLATFSNGEMIENPRFVECSAKTIARLNRSIERKQLGSHSRERVRMCVAKVHQHVANQKREYARKAAKEIFDRYDLVAHEDTRDLTDRLMTGRFSKSFHDASWGVFLKALASKAEGAGKHLVPVDPRMTSQLCSRCGKIVKKTLSQRVHRCECGLVIDRDHNSAITVLARGLRAMELAKASAEVEVSQEAESCRCSSF